MQIVVSHSPILYPISTERSVYPKLKIRLLCQLKVLAEGVYEKTTAAATIMLQSNNIIGLKRKIVLAARAIHYFCAFLCRTPQKNNVKCVWCEQIRNNREILKVALSCSSLTFPCPRWVRTGLQKESKTHTCTSCAQAWMKHIEWLW